ncbi:MAG: malto-oligosyltrehalose trehalohydrolase [Chloroflexota bacterium]
MLPDGSTKFTVWAPQHERVEVHISEPADRIVPLESGARGYHSATVDVVAAGALYKLRLPDARELSDPASRFQPEGVHGRSQVVADDFGWTDERWRGRELADYVIYELHTGTFSAEGTFDGIIPWLDAVVELGITAIEVMPIAQFPGARNWGYDGVSMFAPQNSYGGPDGLRRLVDAAHSRGLGVVLDVVYNHLGPEGNYLGEFGPYFTDRYWTAWGSAMNYDGPGSDEVRRFFLENALMWVRDYHIDALRLDAVHAIIDTSARTFLQELAEAVHAEAARLGRRIHLIAETDLNDPRIVSAPESGGYGHDAQWSDDFHHALHALITGENDGYYADFGETEHLAKTLRQGYAYTGQHSQFRSRRHGAMPVGLGGEKFVVCSQNHDQVGNRMLGERLSTLTSFEGLKVAAAATILSPFIPMLFMGEEYGETAPFLYFVDHSDKELLDAVRKGRAAEFTAFGWDAEPPDPGAPETHAQSRLRHELASEGEHATLRDFYKMLLRLRRTHAALGDLCLTNAVVTASNDTKTLVMRRFSDQAESFVAFNFSDEIVECTAPQGETLWHRVIDSADEKWRGSGAVSPQQAQGGKPLKLAPMSFALYLERAIG